MLIVTRLFINFLHILCIREHNECTKTSEKWPVCGFYWFSTWTLSMVKICLLVNNFFIRCCLKDLAHPANPWRLSAFSASNQIPISHVLTELLKIFLPEVGKFLQMSAIVVVVVTWFPAVIGGIPFLPCLLVLYSVCPQKPLTLAIIFEW